MKKMLSIIALLAIVLTGFSQPNTSTVLGNWNVPENWSLTHVPLATEDVVIDEPITIQSGTNAVAKSVQVGGAAASTLTIWETLNILETNGNSLTISHVNSSVHVNGTLTYIGNVVVNDGELKIDGDMYVSVVTSPTGKIWMDRNLGASQVATSSTDADAYGDLYQWGRDTEGHEIRTSSTTSTNATTAVPSGGGGGSWDGLFITEVDSPYNWLSNQDNTLWQGVNGTNNPCPSGFRLPTTGEWVTERLSWTTNDAAGAFNSPLKLTVGGNRGYSDGGENYVDTEGYYWSTTVDGTGTFINYLNFNTSNSKIQPDGRRASGASVRCIKN